jgi:phage/plasmid-like protein (TIGR03299 family)
MPANVGEMFYFGDVPWHGQGKKLDLPANFEEAIQAGGLDWDVGMAPLCTNEEPPSPVKTRLAIVRQDRPKGHPKRVLGVAHKGFKPLQNRRGIEIFDSIFGKGKRVYHTGGYLGSGEVVWVMAELPKNIKVTDADQVKTYSLFTNSHNGSIAIDFRLTTVRVVCQNTLSVALKEKDKRTFFKRAHQGNYEELQQEVESFFFDTLKAADELETQFKNMLNRKFDDDQIKAYIENLFPEPKKPARADTNSRVKNLYLARVKKAKEARSQISSLRSNGKGSDIKGVKDSLWGTFNAVLEFIDHHERNSRNNIASNLFGTGAALKRKAFDLALGYLH